MKFVKIFILLICSSIALQATPPSKKDSINYPIRRIIFDNAFRVDSNAVDSTNLKLHILNPWYVGNYSNSLLIRLGYPLMTNDLTYRFLKRDYFPSANSYLPYLQDANENFFFDTNKPYTILTYKSAGEIRNTEDYLQILHTQNLTRRSNLSLNYNLYSSYSKADIQKATDHSVGFFYRYSGERYLGYYHFYYNSFDITENGGVNKDSLVDYTSANYYGVGVNLLNSSSKFGKIGFNSIQELKFSSLFNSQDSVKNLRDYGSLFYNLNIEMSKRSFTEKSVERGYQNYYYRTDRSYDSTGFTKISNKFLLNSPQLVRYLPNLRLSFTNEIYDVEFGKMPDTIYDSSSKFSNLNHTGIYYRNWSTLDITQTFNQVIWNFSWDSYIIGYGLGDQSLKATAKLYANKKKSIGLVLTWLSELRTPSFLYNEYYSNHFKWDKSFEQEKLQYISGTASLLNPKIELTGSYLHLSDFVYFSEKALPEVGGNLDILSFKLDSRLQLWKIGIENYIIYQLPVPDKFANVPSLIYYNSTDFQHVFHFFTGGRLYTKLGVDVLYTSMFKPMAYMPATGIFYMYNPEGNTVIKTGNYPKIDLHLTIKVKAVSFFIKYSHFNAGYSGKRQFWALHYPALPSIFSYGINWLFYD